MDLHGRKDRRAEGKRTDQLSLESLKEDVDGRQRERGMTIPHSFDSPREHPSSLLRYQLEINGEGRFDREGEGSFLFRFEGREDEGVDASCGGSRSSFARSGREKESVKRRRRRGRRRERGKRNERATPFFPANATESL